MLPTVNLSRSC